MQRPHYCPPWSDTSIIGIAGSSGSGKTSLAHAIVEKLNLPWVVILSMDSFYNPLTPDQSEKAFKNEFDFDAPEAIDFDLLLQVLQDVQAGKKADVPIYSFAKHNREEKTSSIYSPHVLILEGIFALHDPRILNTMDVKIFAQADGDLCLSRRLLRDVKERGRDIEGCIKQWFSFVKPNFVKYVEPQQEVADIIVPRGIENIVAIDMVSDRIHKLLDSKSLSHREHLSKLHEHARTMAQRMSRSPNVILIPPGPQVTGITTLLLTPSTNREDFIFYTDRLASMVLDRALSCNGYAPQLITTPQNTKYNGLKPAGEVVATVLLRGGGVLENALNRTVPNCRIGRILIQSADEKEREPALHYHSLPPYKAAQEASDDDDQIASPVSGGAAHAIQVTSKAAPGKKAKLRAAQKKNPQDAGGDDEMGQLAQAGTSSITGTGQPLSQLPPLMLLLDAQLESGAAALMAVRVLLDHGVPEDRIVYVVLRAGEVGLRRLLSVYPEVRVVLAGFGGEGEGRWLEKKYLGC